MPPFLRSKTVREDHDHRGLKRRSNTVGRAATVNKLAALRLSESDDALFSEDHALAGLRFWNQSQSFWRDGPTSLNKPDLSPPSSSSSSSPESDGSLPGDRALLRMRTRNIGKSNLASHGHNILCTPPVSSKTLEVFDSQSDRVRSKIDRLVGKVCADATDLRGRLEERMLVETSVGKF
eukprot:gnl/MRDRNA2_/MRDRNA2_28377_c0_seq1.p1 gnl/MRDRNA2_/MRDRNA2_28377_c0~~gnl/MRDRNA2_/MRDRNA2_28377_c0_seq1.p1  ORF type:complete len:179 (-),score=22.46 gnl/MRDRNA2_/MRDRNA2_28377_c0_seq1:400-936(-)